MHVTVKGKNFDVPATLRDEAIETLNRSSRLFDHFLDTEVVFIEESNPRIRDKYRCEITTHGKGSRMHASATGPDASSALDKAGSKIQRQVRKLKTKVVERRRRQASGRRTELAGVIADE